MNGSCRTPAQCQADFAAGDWAPELCDDIWACVELNPLPRTLCLAFDIQHCLEGLNAHHIEVLSRYMDQRQRTYWPLYWRLLSAELQLGYTDHAAQRTANAINRFPSLAGSLSLRQFPLALQHQACRYPKALGYGAKRHAMLASDLLSRTGSLPEIINSAIASKASQADSGPTIAVVGNGPTLTGSGAGRRIDESDYTLRFNNVHIDKAREHDTGTRTDLWVISPGLNLKAARQVADMACVTGPAPLFRRSRYWMKLATLPIQQLAEVPLTSWYALVKQLQAPPSAGILVLDSLIRQCPSVDVEIHGFTIRSNIDPENHCAGSHYGDHRKASERHAWGKEAEILQQWVDDRQIIHGCR